MLPKLPNCCSESASCLSNADSPRVQPRLPWPTTAFQPCSATWSTSLLGAQPSFSPQLGPPAQVWRRGCPIPHHCSRLWCRFFTPARWIGLENEYGVSSERELSLCLCSGSNIIRVRCEPLHLANWHCPSCDPLGPPHVTPPQGRSSDHPLIHAGPPWDVVQSTKIAPLLCCLETPVSGNIFPITHVHSFHLPPQSSSSDPATKLEVDLATHLGIPLLKWYFGHFDSTSNLSPDRNLLPECQLSNAPSSNPLPLSCAIWGQFYWLKPPHLGLKLAATPIQDGQTLCCASYTLTTL